MKLTVLMHLRFIRLLFCALLLVACLAISSGAAHASPAVLTCLAGTFTNTYSPGITNTRQSIKISAHEDLDDCTATGSNLTAGSTSYSVTVTTSCLLGINIPSISSAVYHWNDGSSSTIATITDISTRLVNGTLQVTATGHVVAGYGSGSLATYTIVLPQLDPLKCATPQGVTQQQGPESLNFV
ncbi:hypothetical protein EPA93_31690 [Ktedonosporobacter rubrisoli]|uniref:Ig-like domain-containing protein n=1 Tax=Ktedonosporobacter rubrisoli TaxID=2509675 RepID=A0A4P6JXX2_KTERU|nr:hypothetical protein [Ktedonosporobacter rubrisoli]QBD80293.1 hypothetical protein EPA93_31690 [Ktedonosporobacter rubrisoli]